MRSRILSAALLLLLAVPAAAQEPAGFPFRAPDPDPRLFAPTAAAQEPRRPAGPAEPDYVDQVLMGVGGGLGGALAVGGAWAAFLSVQDQAELNEFAWLGPLIGALVVGYPVGSAAGVYLGSRRTASGGSAGFTLVGSALGWLAGTAVAGPTAGITYFLGPPVGAALAYNLSRRRSRPASAPPPEASR